MPYSTATRLMTVYRRAEAELALAEQTLRGTSTGTWVSTSADALRTLLDEMTTAILLVRQDRAVHDTVTLLALV